MMAFVLILCTFIIVAAIVAVEARGLLSTVISVGAAGLGLSVLFLLLGAPDLAITQVVVEVLCLILLIRAAIIREDSTLEARQNRFVVTVGLIGGGVLITLCYFVFQKLTPFGQPVMSLADQYLKNGLEKTGAAVSVRPTLFFSNTRSAR